MSAIYRNGKWYGKDNGHIIMNNAGLELKPRATLQFGGDLSTTDDNTNERTVIKPHEISSEEWDDIVNLLPGGVPNNGVVIDTRGNEYIVGKYIESDGTIKPIYQKVFDHGSSISVSNTVWTDTGISITNNNIDHVIFAFALSAGVSDDDCLFMLNVHTESSVSNVNAIVARANNSGLCRYFVLQYTKTTD